MKNIIVLFILLAVVSASYCQAFNYPVIQPRGKSINDFIPSNWILKDSSVGDLNGDHIKDMALVIQCKDTVNEFRPDSSFHKAKPVVLLIFFKNSSGLFHLVLQNNTVILRSGEGGWDDDPYRKLDISKQILSITFDVNRGFSTYKFKYQNENFFLIGAIDEITGHGETSHTEVNFLTRKENDEWSNGEHVITKWRTILPGKLVKLKDLKMPGQIEIQPGYYL